MAALFIVAFVAIVGVFMYIAQQTEQGARQLLHDFIDELQQRPLDPSLHAEFHQTIASLSTLPHELSEHAYRTVLAILAEHPDSMSARTFALDVGRWHLGRIRPDKKPTTYDEQAMQNDILVRSQNVTKQPVAAASGNGSMPARIGW